MHKRRNSEYKYDVQISASLPHTFSLISSSSSLHNYSYYKIRLRRKHEATSWETAESIFAGAKFSNSFQKDTSCYRRNISILLYVSAKWRNSRSGELNRTNGMENANEFSTHTRDETLYAFYYGRNRGCANVAWTPGIKRGNVNFAFHRGSLGY